MSQVHVANGHINGVAIVERIVVIQGINFMNSLSKALIAESPITSRRNLCWFFKMEQFLKDTKHLHWTFPPGKGQRFIFTGMPHIFAYNFAFLACEFSACSRTMGCRVFELFSRAFDLLTQYSIHYQFRLWVPLSDRGTTVGVWPRDHLVPLQTPPLRDCHTERDKWHSLFEGTGGALAWRRHPVWMGQHPLWIDKWYFMWGPQGYNNINLTTKSWK